MTGTSTVGLGEQDDEEEIIDEVRSVPIKSAGLLRELTLSRRYEDFSTVGKLISG